MHMGWLTRIRTTIFARLKVHNPNRAVENFEAERGIQHNYHLFVFILNDSFCLSFCTNFYVIEHI